MDAHPSNRAVSQDRDRRGRGSGGFHRQNGMGKLNRAFALFSSALARWTGTVWVFALASVVLFVWLGLGPKFRWSTAWQLAASTTATVITFLMVFVIQATQNRHWTAVQLKLDELLGATKDASEQLIGADELTQSEIQEHREELQRRHGSTSGATSRAKHGGADR